MSDTPPRSDTSIERLIGVVGELGAKVEGLTKAHNRHRTLVRGVIAGLAFDAILSVVYFVGLDRTNDVVGRLNRVDAAAEAVCLASNESATKQHQLWEGLIALPSATPSDPERLARFRALLSDTFPQRDCD